MRQVMFSIRWAWGRVTFVRAYIFQTWVARGSSFASCSGSISGSGEALRSGEPETRGEVNGLVGWGESGGCWVKRSSEKMSLKRVLLPSDTGDVGEWTSGRGTAGDIQSDGGSPCGGYAYPCGRCGGGPSTPLASRAAKTVGLRGAENMACQSSCCQWAMVVDVKARRVPIASHGPTLGPQNPEPGRAPASPHAHSWHSIYLFFAANSSVLASSCHLHAVPSSPRTSPVATNDRMHAGLRSVSQVHIQRHSNAPQVQKRRLRRSKHMHHAHCRNEPEHIRSQRCVKIGRPRPCSPMVIVP